MKTTTATLTAHETLLEIGSNESDQINHDYDHEQYGKITGTGYFIPSREFYA